MTHRVINVSGKFLLHSCNTRLLARIYLEFFNGEASSLEILTNHLSALTMVKSDLNSAGSQTRALEVILVHLRLDDVLHLGDLLELGGFEIRRQASDDPVNDFGIT